MLVGRVATLSPPPDPGLPCRVVSVSLSPPGLGQLKVCDILEGDINRFLDLEKRL